MSKSRTIAFEHHTMDKSRWDYPPDAEWHNEPDKVGWFDDEATGLPCLVVRGPLGQLNGYVGIAASHPWYAPLTDGSDSEKPWNERIEGLIEIHGGLTYIGKPEMIEDEEYGIGWPSIELYAPRLWLGFDCGHAWDICPSMAEWASKDFMFGELSQATYKNLAWVMAETEKLAGQIYGAMTPAERENYRRSAGLDSVPFVDPATSVTTLDDEWPGTDRS